MKTDLVNSPQPLTAKGMEENESLASLYGCLNSFDNDLALRTERTDFEYTQHRG
jgi:hypothetical protein